MVAQPATEAMPAKAVEVTGLSADSRRVEPGYLFAALPGARQDGRAFIPQAVDKGAVAVLAPLETKLPEPGPNPGPEKDIRPVALICDPNPRRRLAELAARFYRHQPSRIAAVTGTNGKTSVADFTRQIWELLGNRAASLGTLGLIPARPDAPASLTTPDPVELHRCLADVAESGIDHLAIEASSHGLDQFRLDGLKLTAAAFTNLSRDHLDYHGSMEAYLAAKRRLFAELLPSGGTAVLNADAPEFETLAEAARARGVAVIEYGRKAKDLRLVERTPTETGQDIAIEVLGRPWRGHLPLVGSFQAHNALAALGLAIATGADPFRATEALARLKGVPGRLEPVGRGPGDAPVFVDYAHTPDALETVLEALRPHVKRRLVCVFGAGGDRDRGKRPLMGAVAARLADLAIVTDDNPRSEDPASIRAEVLAGAREAGLQAEEIGDRAAAIRQAVARLEEGDILVIAGKGHERGQIVGDKVLPFDDREVARNAIASATDQPA